MTKKTCKEDGCERPMKSRGWCQKDYARLYLRPTQKAARPRKVNITITSRWKGQGKYHEPHCPDCGSFVFKPGRCVNCALARQLGAKTPPIPVLEWDTQHSSEESTGQGYKCNDCDAPCGMSGAQRIPLCKVCRGARQVTYDSWQKAEHRPWPKKPKSARASYGTHGEATGR